jgi:hypothetical protein
LGTIAESAILQHLYTPRTACIVLVLVRVLWHAATFAANGFLQRPAVVYATSRLSLVIRVEYMGFVLAFERTHRVLRVKAVGVIATQDLMDLDLALISFLAHEERAEGPPIRGL